MFTKYCLSFLCVACLLYPTANAQIQVTQGADVATVLNQLVGKGVIISNVTLTGRNEAFGTYTRTGGSLPMEKGMLITTGLATNAQGKNNSQNISKSWESAGDADLAGIVTGATLDACVIAFDITPVGKKLTFQYTFASEEYNEYVSDIFNDVFGFFITGQNPAGGNYTKKNIALVPNTNTPVSIKTINNFVNSAYYHDNTQPNPTFDLIQYDGYTKGLTVEIDVVPCATYRLELKIADVEDSELDSGVFIEAITSPLPAFKADFATEYGGLIEGCDQRAFEVVRPRDGVLETVRLNAIGQASFLQDYDVFYEGTKILQLPFTFIMEVGVLKKNFLLVPKADAIQENTETLTLHLEYGCNFEKIDEVTANILEVNDFKPLSNLPAGKDKVYQCAGTETILESYSGKNYQWTASNGTFECLDAACKRIKAGEEQAVYTLTLTIGGCTFLQSVEVIPIERDSITEQKTFCPFPPRSFSIFTEEEEEEQRRQGRVLSYRWTKTQGVSNNVLTVRSLEENGSYVCEVFDEVSGCLLRYKRMDISVACNPVFEVPTAFTPNRDGLNEALEVFTQDVAKFEVKIFNRWGECVHIMRNKQEAWDGTLKGSPAPAGVYVWQADYATPLYPYRFLRKMGSVSLVR
jgi:gliding motility-associated-like protein